MSQPESLDINKDGRDDVVYTGAPRNEDSGGPQLVIFLANEQGLLEYKPEAVIDDPVASGARQIIPADFNGDGQLDLFMEVHGPEPDCGDGTVHCFTGGQNRLLLSDNEGKLSDATETNLPPYSDFSHGSSVADFDGDGDLDIWVNNLGGSPLYDPGFPYLLFNDGQGSFTVVADLYVICCDTPIAGRNGILPEGDYGSGAWSIPIDVDGDGDKDLLFGRATDWTNFHQGGELDFYNRLLVNDGEGRFSILSGDSYPSTGCRLSPNQPDADACRHDDLPMAQHALVYDLNRDGLDDMLIHQSIIWWEGGTPEITDLQVLISNGDGTFRDESAERYPDGRSESRSDFQLHDLDNDGHMDLFSHVVYEVNDFNDIRINDGEGFFRPLSKSWASSTRLGVAWVVLDVDGDGGTDFLNQDPVLHKMNLPYGAVLDGTSEDDRLIGGAHDNVFRGLAGNDVLDGGLGDDDLDGGAGDDELIGGKGDERMVSGSGTDSVNGGPGRDRIEYAFSIDDAEILLGATTHIARGNTSNDEIKATEYALFSDAAIPLPTAEQSAIGSLNGVAGLWYDPALDGEGFNVITTPSGTVIFFYGYTAQGQRLWLISETVSAGITFNEVLDLRMYEAQGGTFDQPAPSSEAVVDWGRLKGLFDACGTGRFALHGADGVKVTYQIKLAGITNADCATGTLSAPSGLAGLWYDQTLDGEGYNVIITENSTVFFFYGYDANGQRLWLISEALAGAPAVGESTQLQMFSASGGTFDTPAPPAEALTEWGNLDLTFSSCGEAVANLTGTDGKKTSNLTKLAGISDSACP